MAFLRIAWPYSPWGTHDQLRSAFQGLLDLGINAICCYRHIDDYRDDASATDRYDLRYNIAAEMGIKIIQYTGVHRLEYKGAKTGEYFVQRYSKFPACGGFTYGDEPNYMGWDHAGCKWAVDEAHRQGASPSENPMFAVFGYDLSVNYAKTYTPGCEIFDIGCACCYPTALAGGDWKSFLEYWVDHGYHRPNNDGFGDCGKGMIPVIQAHVESAASKHGAMMPDLVGEYNVWKAKYGNQIKGIGFWLPYAGGDAVGFLESGSVAENLRSQIKEISRLTGWSPAPPVPPPPPETIEEIRDFYWAQGFQVWRPGSIVDDSENGAQSGYVAKIDHTHAWVVQASMMAQYGFENREYDISVRIRGTSDSIRWGVYDRSSMTHRKAEASLYGITNEYQTLHLGKFNHLWSDHDIYLYLPGKDDHVYYIDWFLFKSDTEEKYLPTALPAPPVYSCPYCPATFGTQAELDAHIASEHPVFTCPECGATFASQADLDSHIATVHPPAVFTCPECGATFITQAELDAHIASEHPAPVYECPHCGLTFGTQAELDAHIASEHPVFTCPECGATFASQADLDSHIATVHPPPTYTCPHCGEVFGSQADLDAHIASEHPAPVYECPHCGLILATQVELEAHVASEHPAAPVFKCIYCGAIFASQADLNAHMATEHPVAAEVVPWWKSWKTYALLGGIGTLIGGIVIKKRLAKRRKSNTMV